MEINVPGSGGGGGPKLPPDFNKWIVPIVVLVIVVISLTTLVYTVSPDEEGVVKRFGKYVRTTSPGLRFKIPFGVETVKKVRVTHIYKEEFGFKTLRAGVRTTFARGGASGRTPFGKRTRSMFGASGDPFLAQSLMLTGDLNCAEVEWIVQYRIKDPVKYLFRVRDVKATISNMSEATMRLAVGDHTINEVLTTGRETIRTEVKENLQKLMDEYGTGVDIVNVVLQDVTPPDQVKPSFNEVNEARQEKERLINQAWEDYNRVIPRARGEAEKTINQAEGYSLERVNRAKGDAFRFTATWEEYKKAVDVTRRRLYLETMKKLLPQVKEKVILDTDVKGIVPLLQLSEAEKGGKQS